VSGLFGVPDPDYGTHKLKRRLRCPKCRKAPRQIVEYIVGASVFDVLEDGAVRDGEGIHEPGGYFKVEAKCGCGHRWRLKGVTQVTDLDDPTAGTGEA
jgi:hypothetical protein